MKFKDLTEEQKNSIREIYKNKDLSWDDRMLKLTNMLGKSERTIRKWCSNKLNLKEKNEPIPEQYELAKSKSVDKTKKYYIISWAQNNTKVHDNLLKNIENYASFLDANIHIIAGRYRNPTQPLENLKDEWWDKKIIAYLDANRHNIHKYVSIMSDIKIQPTAVNPMSDLQGISGSNSCIFGAPKIQLETIPVLDGCVPKMMLTTGAITNKNYSDSKSGKKGEFHHTYGFTIVEIKDNETFFVRQITADDKTGNFTDLCYRVENGVVNKISELEAIVLGDLHYGHHDEKVLNNTLDFMGKIKPKHVVIHDVFDGYSISHHDMKDPFIQYSKEIKNTNSLKKEVDEMLDGLKHFEKYENVVIVRSNHDDFLDRWLKNEDWKKQPTPKNSPEYMKYSSILLEQYASDSNNVKGVIPYLINEKYPKYITLNRNSSYKIKGFECGVHGDQGSNGSRGSVLNFRKLNTKLIVGHYHAPARKDGVLAVGTTTKLRVGYNLGPSSWVQGHVLIHKDGRAQHILFSNGQFTTFDI